MAKNNVALVPLRGGSKSIPKKNIKLIAGQPLCAWVLRAAIASGIFSKVVISTNSNEIADVVNKLQLGVEVIERPDHLATDTASTESVMLHAVENLDFYVLTTIQATSPLVLPDDFTLAYKKMCEENLDSIVTGVRTKRFFWEDNGKPLNYDPQKRPRRQDFQGVIMENGAFYMTKRSILKKYKCRLGGKIGVCEMGADSAVEIDEPEDWCKVEKLLIKRKWKTDFRLQNIKLLVVDVDGTLTDGGMYYSSEGEALKKFNTRDAKGLELVRKKGIEVALMTSENSEIVAARARKLGINHCYLGITNKKTLLGEITKEMGMTLLNVGYIGDDLNDLECMKAVGFSAAPCDGESEILDVADYISAKTGGKGAVREICNLILSAGAELKSKGRDR